jgi:hypothetical protein
MELVEIDAFEPKIAQTPLDGPSQVRFAIVDPHPGIVGCGRAASRHPAFGADDEIRRIWAQRVTQQAFVVAGFVDIGRVDEIDAKFDRPP